MSRHIEAWMNGVQLSSIGPVLIQDVQENAPTQETIYSARPVRSGQDVQKNRRTSLRVIIQAAIRELYDLPRRTAILQQIAAWASGGVLELSNHPGQRLHVIGKASPALGNVRDYTSRIAIELEADAIPFWEAITPMSVSGSGTSGTANLNIEGTASEIPVEAEFTPSGRLTSLSVTVASGGASRTIALTGMSVTDPIVFGRDDCDRLTIKSGSTSLLRYRSAASADDLIVPHGAAVITWSANVSGTAVFSARGRWL